MSTNWEAYIITFEKEKSLINSYSKYLQEFQNLENFHSVSMDIKGKLKSVFKKARMEYLAGLSISSNEEKFINKI
ncbi:MAG: hypothetical protein AAF502_25515 [Bacteroidota bacterium]